MAVKGNEPLLYTANPFLLSLSFLLSILPVEFEKLKVRVTLWSVYSKHMDALYNPNWD